MGEEIQIRIHGDAALPTLVYLPGLHGDWTLVTSFRCALENRVRVVVAVYPRTLTLSLEEYTQAVETALLAHGINKAWILGESWGSQIAWKLVGRNLATAARPAGLAAAGFHVEGLIFAGGFVKHPWSWGPPALGWIGQHTPTLFYRLGLGVYARYARFRHRHAPETLASIGEFVERRTELDRRAMRHRLDLLSTYDPRPVACATRLPVHYLAGLVDPLVPWPLVRRWLRRNCPGYRGGRTFWLADHNVLATAPVRSADLVVEWMKAEQ
jgi:pimeloyl-ACP methyl ester carboxylesterase